MTKTQSQSSQSVSVRILQCVNAPLQVIHRHVKQGQDLIRGWRFDGTAGGGAGTQIPQEGAEAVLCCTITMNAPKQCSDSRPQGVFGDAVQHPCASLVGAQPTLRAAAHSSGSTRDKGNNKQLLALPFPITQEPPSHPWGSLPWVTRPDHTSNEQSEGCKYRYKC